MANSRQRVTSRQPAAEKKIPTKGPQGPVGSHYSDPNHDRVVDLKGSIIVKEPGQ